MLRPSVEVRVSFEITVLGRERALTSPSLPKGEGKNQRAGGFAWARKIPSPIPMGDG
jgi:hypothetical protein